LQIRHRVTTTCTATTVLPGTLGSPGVASTYHKLQVLIIIYAGSIYTNSRLLAATSSTMLLPA
jgi:hypothetical protein